MNSRHLVYGISFPLQNVKGFWAKLYAIYTLCDESYALNTGPDRNTLSHRTYSMGEYIPAHQLGGRNNRRVLYWRIVSEPP